MEISTKLPVCKDCYKRLISNLKENTNKRRECNNCFCWNINPNDPKQQIMKVPDKYLQHKEVLKRDGTQMQPPIGREPGRKHIGLIRLSAEWLTLKETETKAMDSRQPERLPKNMLRQFRQDWDH
jgi:hypothetical protein